jgi:DNA-binding beta-propeller fold protein YncE
VPSTPIRVTRHAALSLPPSFLRPLWALGFRLPRLLPLLLVCIGIASPRLEAQVFVSGNENKIDLTSGKPRWIEGAAPDSLSVIDFQQFPPRVRHLRDIGNTVIGPPSNILVTRDGKRAILANSIRGDAQGQPDPWVPNHEVYLVDLTSNPMKVLSTAKLEAQPSGMSWASDESWLLVACRAAGKIQRVAVRGDELIAGLSVDVGRPEDAVSDVAITPDGMTAIVSVHKAGHLRRVDIRGDQLLASDEKASTYGQPYRVVVTPDGELALTAGPGFANNGLDLDALTIVDLSVRPMRTIEYVTVGSGPESLEISPDGRWLAVVLMAGSNYPPEDPRHSETAELVLLRREAKSFRIHQRLPIGRIPEGVAFTPDGQHLLVQCHPDRQIWVFRMEDAGASDAGYRIDVPGMPSSLRASR